MRFLSLMEPWRLALMLTVLMGMAACGTVRVDPYLGERIEGSDFNAFLAREYQRRVRIERNVDEDWVHAGRLAGKGRDAQAGKVVEPWIPVEWNILPADLADLDDARARLMARLERGRAQTPQACARAQVYFDGWVEQANDNDLGEGWQGPVQADYVASERAAFEDILPRCGGPVRVEPVPVRAPSTEQRFIIYFGWNRTDLTDEAQDLIEGVVDYIEELGDAAIALEGHTDSSGTEPYNEQLSRDRAERVRRALEGADVGVTSLGWFGESRPAVPTADNVREPLNRRVEVLVVRDR